MARLNQEELLEIFNAVKQQMKPYEKGNLVAKFDIQGRYELWSVNEVVIMGRKRTELAFVGLILQSSYVGFYYMPVYTNCDKVVNSLSPEFMKLLKGKSCFHIKKVDDALLKDVKAAMKVGLEVYKNNGWV